MPAGRNVNAIENSTNGKPELQVCADAGVLAAALAERVAPLAARAAAARGRFTIAVPGGSALALLGRGLAGRRGAAAVDGSAWHVFWVDERCVPPDHPDSNRGAAERELLAPLAIPRGQIHPMDGAGKPTAAARDYEAVLARNIAADGAGWPRFDLVLLGLGEDGHVASLFPGHPALDERQRRVVPVLDSPKPPPARLTLTLPVINHARNVLVVASGAGKAAVVARIRTAAAGGPALPAARICPAAGNLGWLIDRAAAAGLPATLSTPAVAGKEIP